MFYDSKPDSEQFFRLGGRQRNGGGKAQFCDARILVLSARSMGIDGDLT